MKPGLRRKIQSAQRIFVAGGTGFPETLVEDFLADPDLLRGKEVVSCFIAGFEHRLPRVLDGRLEVFFGTPELLGRPETKFVPMQYRRIWNRLEADRFDLALVRMVADENGTLHYGLGVDFQPAALSIANELVVEVVQQAPYVYDAPAVPTDALITTMEGKVGKCGARSTPAQRDCLGVADVARRIGEHVALLVRDGDCLQIGIGAIPEAVLAALKDHKNLGCHSGMISGGVAELFQSGVLTGKSKTVDREKVVTGFVLGDQSTEQWAAECRQVALRPVCYTHDARVLGAIDNLVAINSALEVDLAGQVNAEMIGGRQLSGVGGAVDFARGAGLSNHGRSIVALPSTARNGQVSRIVGVLGWGNSATLLRTDIDYVVTEHGVAALAGVDTERRGQRLVKIAAPEFREGLMESLSGAKS